MPRGLKIVLAFITGLIIGEAIPIIGYILATNYFGLFDRDGGGAMGAVFLIGPVVAIVLAITAAIVTAIRTRTTGTRGSLVGENINRSVDNRPDRGNIQPNG